jgi:hypothetical protein
MDKRIAWFESRQKILDGINLYRHDDGSGCHIALLGTTRGGKTTLAKNAILPLFEDVLVIDSSDDRGLKGYGKPLNKYGAIHGLRRLTVTDMSPESKRKIHGAMARALKQGDIAIYADEVRQLTDPRFFGLTGAMEHLWLFGAKRGVSLIGGTQAPRWVPSSFYEQSKMHIIFGIRDERAKKRLAEISGDIDTLKLVIPTLKRYEFALVDSDGEVSISKYPKGPRRATIKKDVPKEKRFSVRSP